MKAPSGAFNIVSQFVLSLFAFHREIPVGYVESVTYDGNLIEEPAVRELYSVVRL